MNVNKSQPYYKYGKIIFLILSVGWASQSLIAQNNFRDIVEKVKPSIVAIFTYDTAGEPIGYGSGFIMSIGGDVITSRYVLEGASRIEIVTMDGKKYFINQVLAEDKEGEIIRISTNISNKNIRPLNLSTPIPTEGERILVIGNPLEIEQIITSGIISAVREIPGYGKIMQIAAPLSPYSCGSPLINMKGEVVGIVTFIVLEGINLNLVVSCERLAQLKTIKGKKVSDWQSERSDSQAYLAQKSFNTGNIYFLKGYWVSVRTLYTK